MRREFNPPLSHQNNMTHRYQKKLKSIARIPADLHFGKGMGFDIPVTEIIARKPNKIRLEDDGDWEILHMDSRDFLLFAMEIKRELGKYLTQFKNE